MDGYEENFERVESGASETYPVQCSSLRKNGHVLLKGHACRIVDMSTSKTGKHGHAKVKKTYNVYPVVSRWNVLLQALVQFNVNGSFTC